MFKILVFIVVLAILVSSCTNNDEFTAIKESCLKSNQSTICSYQECLFSHTLGMKEHDDASTIYYSCLLSRCKV